jgi:radical SAM superfamily enzyme YgiQ (UPF0313 family)
MKILLINPPYDSENYYGKSMSEMAFVFPPVGLTYLAGYLRQFGHQIYIYDYQIEERKFEQFLNEFQPELIGITCQTALFSNTVILAKRIKELMPAIPLIVGGAHPTYRPNDFFESAVFDVVVRGEGEITFKELVDLYAAGGGDLSVVDGINFKKDGVIVRNPDRLLIENLDILPIPAVDLLPLEKYHVSPDNYLGGQMALINTSRGCPYGCIFCACKEAFNRTYRVRDLDRVFEEIKYYLDNYNVSELFLMDDCFGLDRARSIKFCQGMIDRGYGEKLKWWCQIRVDIVDKELLEYMKRAGCRFVSFGIESGVQRLLDSISKRVTLQQIEKAVRLVNEVGMEPRGSFILGLPTETFKDSLTTIFFALRLPLKRAKFGLATPYPGTKLWEIALAEGQVKAEGEDWNRFTAMAAYTKFSPSYIPHGRKIFELQFLQKIANMSFYFKPSVVISFVKKVKNYDDFKYFLKSLVKFLYSSIKR